MLKVFFRGRRLWPQAISYPPTPRGVWGFGEKEGASRRPGVVNEVAKANQGGRGLVEKEPLGLPGLPRGTCNPLQPARSPSILEGAGGSLARTGCAMERPGDFAASEDAILEAIWSCPSTIFGPSWVSGEFEEPRIQQS